MKKIKIQIVFLIFTCSMLYSVNSHTTENPANEWLKNTPVSLLIWGIDRLEKKIERGIDIDKYEKDHFEFSSHAVRYQETTDSIVAKFSLIESPNTRHKRSNCYAAIVNAKKVMGYPEEYIDAANDNKQHPKVSMVWHGSLKSSYSVLERTFGAAHFGYELQSKPSDLGKKIAEMILVTIELHDVNRKEKLTCSSRLLEHNVIYE